VACNLLDKIFIVISSSKSCANLSIPEFLLLLFRSSFCAIFVLVFGGFVLGVIPRI
jgi:hypothetical protein